MNNGKIEVYKPNYAWATMGVFILIGVLIWILGGNVFPLLHLVLVYSGMVVSMWHTAHEANRHFLGDDYDKG